MPDIQDIVNVTATFLGYATPITIIFAVSHAGLGLLYRAITGKEW